ncbi:nuclear transport factor 2 family protein [Gaopeijia maritima]|uniref:Nuclear transport factor 2 family protein n=1 Tax=Gaopeijia maritima TaxID=3119007 RepID=A0ABU9EEZ4_9BACT
MSRLLLPSATLVALTALAVAAPAHAQHDDLLRINRELFHSQMVEGDSLFLLDHSVPEYLVVGPGGVVEDRRRVIDGLGAFEGIDSLTISRERVHASDTHVVVTNRLEIHGSVALPIGPIGPLTVATTFVRRDGRWLALSRTSTPCLPAAAARELC